MHSIAVGRFRYNGCNSYAIKTVHVPSLMHYIGSSSFTKSNPIYISDLKESQFYNVLSNYLFNSSTSTCSFLNQECYIWLSL